MGMDENEQVAKLNPLMEEEGEEQLKAFPPSYSKLEYG